MPIRLCEMIPRDGMQVLNRSNAIPFQMRLDLLATLQKARLPYIEVGSFVSPKVFPQMEDTPRLFERLAPYDGQLAGLVPNAKYYERFQATPNMDTVALFLSASEAYSQANKRISIEDDLADAARIADAAKANHHRLRAHLSAAFRDLTDANRPSPPEQVADICRRLIDMGCEEIALADTDGRAFPTDVDKTLTYLLKAIPADRLAVHLHDRYGQGVANALAAYRCGIRGFDASVGAIGGSKAVKNTVGNVSTEKLVLLFEGIGESTGVDIGALRGALHLVGRMARLAGEPPPATAFLDEELAGFRRD